MVTQTDFIFDLQLRDKLLFEDADYTFSRRYFWAFNCLAMMNDSIRSMITAYTTTFSDKFWLGKDPHLWPLPNPESLEGRNYLRQLSHLRDGIESSIDDLRRLIKSNDHLRQQIESLRDQLYSGSSVKENRLAIEQGENIKILTGVSMLFLPLSFVTVSLPFPRLTLSLVFSTLIILLSRMAVGVWNADFHNISNRLALCGHHGCSLCTIFHPDICPPDTRRHELVSKIASVHYKFSGEMATKCGCAPGKPQSNAANGDDQEAVLCYDRCCRKAREYVEL